MKKIVALLMLPVSIHCYSQDRYFARTYTTSILPKGNIDVEMWHTSRIGHKGQFFHAQDQRIELEMGLGKNVQTAFYFNAYQKRFSNGTDGTTSGNEVGFSNEWKWRTSKPNAKMNCALYGEWGIKGGDEAELEMKVILDKSKGKNLFAFNGIVEYEREFEWENGKLSSSKWETPVEFDVACMRNLNNNWGIGFEIRNHNEIAKGEGWEYSVFFGGPTVNYRADRWFMVANYLPQWGNIHKTKEAPFSKVLDTKERMEARIIIGISL